MTEMEQWVDQFKKETTENLVFVYAKGEKNMAMCGFSHRVMEILNNVGVDYQVRNILVDPIIRQALSSYTDWPTIPQVFIGGKFVGGCDIVTEMFESGELQSAIEAAKSEKAGTSA
ncbi:MAG: Grx4 family monothiol glutaredoxin [Acidobacteriota bacterium]|nr:Grx4 family monothiol glutaredoxin [Acidobacteriota bacterium]